MTDSIPACIICFNIRDDGTYPPTLTFHNLQEALYVVVHDQNVERVMLLGDIVVRRQKFRSYEEYKSKRDSFEHPVAQAIFDILVGEYEQKMT